MLSSSSSELRSSFLSCFMSDFDSGSYRLSSVISHVPVYRKALTIFSWSAPPPRPSLDASTTYTASHFPDARSDSSSFIASRPSMVSPDLTSVYHWLILCWFSSAMPG